MTAGRSGGMDLTDGRVDDLGQEAGEGPVQLVAGQQGDQVGWISPMAE